ncbi:MAG: insulinase family protein [Opitutales bacterium]|nr:insulinase family protein [Opitutales bacterium]
MPKTKILLAALFAAACTLNASEASAISAGASSLKKTEMETIAIDENLSVKKLPNGFTVYFYKNAEPPKRVSMRLIVGRGSSTEKAGQEGLAHFLEHMAFNGTKNFPKGDMVEYFQRLGMAFGADTNAYTSFNETVFKIDIPSNSEAMVCDGLKLFRDYADGILFDPSAIESERGVILAEKKSRDSADYRASVELLGALFKGTPYENRMPIGLESVIKNAPRAEFLDFYKSNYRPENMSLVVVGDIETGALFKAAEKYFESLSPDNSAPASVLPEFKLLRGAPCEISAFRTIDSDLKGSSASIYFVGDLFDASDTPKSRALALKMQVLARIISMRLDAAKSAPDAAYVSAGADFGSFEKSANIFSVSARANVGGSLAAMKNVMKIWKSLEKFGVGSWELEKAKAEILNSLESAANAEKTRKSAQLSDEIVEAICEGRIPTSPKFDLEFARSALKDFSAAEASSLVKFIDSDFKGYARFADAKIPENSAKTAREDFEKISAFEPSDTRLKASELKFSKFGAAGKIVSDKTEMLGIREIAFSNGVRANLKKTDFTKEEIIINVSFGGGKFDTPVLNPALAEIASGFLLGGTACQSYDEIVLAKSDRQIELSFTVENGAFSLTAACAPKSFAEAASLLATYMDAPAFRQEALAQIRKIEELKYRMMQTQPDAAMARVCGWLLNGNYMLSIPEYADVLNCDMPRLKAWLEPIVKNSYMEVSVAGDIDEESALKIIGETFGALSPREKTRADYSAKKAVEFTLDDDKTLFVKNSNDPRAVVASIWRTCGRGEVKEMRACNILASVLSDELRKSVREGAGKAYSPFAYNNSEQYFDYGTLCAVSEVSPENADDVLKIIAASAEKIAGGISADEFERAKAPILKSVEKTRRVNSYWALAAMPMLQAEPVKREIARTFETGYSEISLGDVLEASKKYLKNQKNYGVKILPQKSN